MSTRTQSYRQAYVALACVLITVASCAFCAGFALAHVLAKPELHVIRVPAAQASEV